MNTGDKYAELQDEGKAPEFNNYIKTVTVKGYNQRMDLLKDMAVKIESYICSYKSDQNRYKEGKALIERFKQIEAEEDLKNELKLNTK